MFDTLKTWSLWFLGIFIGFFRELILGMSYNDVYLTLAIIVLLINASYTIWKWRKNKKFYKQREKENA